MPAGEKPDCKQSAANGPYPTDLLFPKRHSDLFKIILE
jgi:hypothetical protein